MSENSFDNEVSKLYQQRKKEIVTPTINVYAMRNKSNVSWSKLILLFLAGSTASFGIFAIISHLVNKPEVVIQSVNTNYEIELKQTPVAPMTNQNIVVRQPLPPKPQITESNKSSFIPVVKDNLGSKVASLALSSPNMPAVTLQEISEPKFALTPIYQVMPKYSAKARHANKVGEIRLRYQINSLGEVNNIETVSGKLDRSLQLSARKALAQWRYPPNENDKKKFEVIFEFSAN